MDRLLESLNAAPIIDKDGYQYLVHPISNGVPMLDPALLREVVVELTRAADLDVDKIVALRRWGSTWPPPSRCEPTSRLS